MDGQGDSYIPSKTLFVEGYQKQNEISKPYLACIGSNYCSRSL